MIERNEWRVRGWKKKKTTENEIKWKNDPIVEEKQIESFEWMK